MSDVAVLEGADVVEGRDEPSCIPIDLGVVYRRVDAHLRANCDSALIAVEMPAQDRLVTPGYWVFEAPLQHGGVVREIGLVDRARELNCLEPFEVPMAHYYRAPPH